jgi:hypothetical protein
MANAATNGDVPELFAMMKRGEVDINKVLPRFFQEVEAQAAGGWDKYRQTTRYQQGQTSFQFEEQLRNFGSFGGNQAFFQIWKSFADTLPKSTELVKALAGAFQGFARGVEGAGKIIVMLNDGFKAFNELSPEVKDGLETIGLAAILLGTRLGRAFLPLTAAFLILEDIATYRQGGKSITGLAMGENYTDYSGVPTNIKNPLAGKRVVTPLESLNGLPTAQAMTVSQNRLASGQLGMWEQTKETANWWGLALGNIWQSTADLFQGSSGAATMPLTRGASIDAMVNQMAYGGQIPQGVSPSGSGNTYNVNISTPSDDPQEHGQLFVRAVQQFSVIE